MKHLFVVVLLVPFLAGCEEPCGDQCDGCPSGGEGCLEKPQDYDTWPQVLQPCGPDDNPYQSCPPVDLPKEMRCSNYGGGSCNHAAFIDVLRWQGQYEVAAWWKKTYSGAEDAEGLAAKADRKGLRFAYTVNGDEKFLDWCSRTRRGAAIHYYPNHAITFCGYDARGNAVLINNNSTSTYVRVPRAQFLANWRSYGGKAITVVYRPWPPKPWTPLRNRQSRVKSDGEDREVASRVIIRIRHPRPIVAPRPWWRPWSRPRPILRPRPIVVLRS